MTEKLTMQDVFNNAYIGVLKQGEPAINRGSNCCYRTTNRGKILKCAIGHSIHDSIYKRSFEGKDPDIILEPYVQNLDGSLLEDIQYAHDDNRYSRNFCFGFKEAMHKIAMKYELKVPELNI